MTPEARRLLEARTDNLTAFADWKERLQAKIRIARLKYELLDADLDVSGLQEEVDDFKRTCRALMWRAPA